MGWWESIFGRKDARQRRQEQDAIEYARQQAQNAADAARERTRRARQLEEDAAARARAMQSDLVRANRAAAAARDAGARSRAEVVRRRAEEAAQQALDQMRQLARERLEQERRQRQLDEQARNEMIRLEQQRARARQALLETRAKMTDEDYEEAFKGPRPARQVYENIKTGEGDLPDKEAFLRAGYPYSAFASSNVLTLQFDPIAGDLYVEYIGNRWYRYVNIGSKQSELLYVAVSKGVAVWDELRVRGTFRGNRYRTERVAGPPTYLPITSSAGAYAAGGGGL